MVRHGRAQEHAREIVDGLNMKINAGLADPKLKARLADLGSSAFIVSPADSENSSPTKPRSGPRS